MNLNNDWFVVVQGSYILSVIDEPWTIWRVKEFDELIAEANENNEGSESNKPYPVGDYLDGTCYVVHISEDTKRNIDGYEWISLRSQLGVAPAHVYQLANRAIQLATWKKQHQHCGQCGKATLVHHEENALHCEPCNLFHYPRISPCMMCLIVKGDYCLLAQHEKHRGGFYSTLAGFVEAGESVEQTLHREVMEEVGLKVKDLTYFSSQSWPFPHQLMVGYFAEYDSGNIVVDGEEIIDAQWFHYSKLPQVPPQESLSGMMIAEFLRQRQR